MTTIAILATLDTKGDEAEFLRARIEAGGATARLYDMGVVGEPRARADVSRETIAEAGGTPLADLLRDPSREAAQPVFIAGASKLLRAEVERGEVQGVIALGGTQGSSTAGVILQALPYGLPKILVSTMAAGDTTPLVGHKDITMMSPVGDILGLNPVTRRVLANAAGAACGMAEVDVPIVPADPSKPTIGITNLGILTAGAMHAIERFREKGYECIVFHAIGQGLAMEELMREGLIGAVFDYAQAEVCDQQFDALRGADDTRLTVAGQLGLPQVIVPGGVDHVGLLVEPNVEPERWAGRKHVWHSPIVFAPRLNADEERIVAKAICERLQHTTGKAVMLFPKGGVSRYGIPGGEIHEPETDLALMEALREHLPPTVEFLEDEHGAEDPAFVDRCVDTLVGLIEA